MDSCSDCVFLKNKKCDLNLFDVIKDKYEYTIEDGILNFNGRCFLKRNEEWAANKENLVEEIKNEIKIKPGIFIPVNNIKSLDYFDKNYKDLVEISPYINIINLCNSASETVIKRYSNNKKFRISHTFINEGPDEIMYNNLKLAKEKFRYMIVVDNPKIKPQKDLISKLENNINWRFNPIVAVVGKGYYVMLTILFYALANTRQNIFEYMGKNLDNKHIINYGDL